MDILVKQLQFVGKHGVYEEEKRDGRRFVVDVTVSLDDHFDVVDDKLDTTIDYRKIAEVILKHGTGPSVDLIETLASRILDDLLNLSPHITSIDLTILKAATGVAGDPEWVGIRSMVLSE